MDNLTKNAGTPIDSDIEGKKLSEENSISFNGRTRESPTEERHAAEERPTTEQENQSANDDNKHDPQLQTLALPENITKKFLNDKNKYYFGDNTVAFIDDGTKLRTKSNNLEVIKSIVQIADHRGWKTIKVAGSEGFRQEVWRQAKLRGIETEGYKPSVLEEQQLERLSKRTQNSHEKDSNQDQKNNPTKPTDDLIKGKLVEHGLANYQFKSDENSSYYLKLQTEQGEKLVWGADLERAVSDSKSRVAIGDEVAIAREGSKPVTVKKQKVDENGHKREEEITSKRVNWRVEKQEYFDERKEKVNAFNNDQLSEKELVKKHPDLTNAVATMHLGTLFANNIINLPKDRERVVKALRETLSDAIERDETIKPPKITKAAIRKLDTLKNNPEQIKQQKEMERSHAQTL